MISSASSLPMYMKYLCLVLVIAYIAFYMHIPVGVLSQARHDDGLFFSQGTNILNGHWLGDFNQFTLMKGPGYGFFLALNALLGIPVTLAQALLHVLATALIAITTWKLTRTRLVSLLCFILILWHPALFPDRIMRDEIYTAQTLLLLAGVLHFLYIPQCLRKRYIWAVGAGGMTAWLWLTREEGLWILPALILLGGITLWQHRKDVRAFRTLCYTISVYSITGLLCYTTVGLINLYTYGTFAIVDITAPAFTAALNALQRVRVGAPVPFVPVPHHVREEIYKVSPTFATLRSYFEGPIGHGWTKPGCAVYPSTCGDVADGWFLWAFRDAVASRQAYTTPQVAATFFRAIAHEVTDACEQRLLTCERPGIIPFLPPMTAEQIASIPVRFWHMIQLLLCKFPSFIGKVPSEGLPEQLTEIRRFLGYPRYTAPANATTITLQGWYYAQGHTWFTMACSTAAGPVVPITFSRLPSPDIAHNFQDPEATQQRFVIRLDAVESCQIQSTTGQKYTLQLSEIHAGKRHILFGQDHFYIDSYTSAADNAIGVRRVGKAYAFLLTIYRRVMPIGAVLGVLAYVYVLATSIYTRRLPRTVLIASMFWCLLLCRIAILILVDISSFPTVQVKYLSAGFPVFCLALLFSGAAVLRLQGQQTADNTSPG